MRARGAAPHVPRGLPLSCAESRRATGALVRRPPSCERLPVRASRARVRSFLGALHDDSGWAVEPATFHRRGRAPGGRLAARGHRGGRRRAVRQGALTPSSQGRPATRPPWPRWVDGTMDAEYVARAAGAPISRRGGARDSAWIGQPQPRLTCLEPGPSRARTDRQAGAAAARACPQRTPRSQSLVWSRILVSPAMTLI